MKKADLGLALYYEMKRIRRIEERIADRYAEQKMRCPVHLSIGQEAIAVGVSHHLSKNDLVVSNHRAHAHFLAKGGNLPRMLAEIYGKETGCCSGRGGSMHLVDLSVGFLGSTPIVAGSIPVGVGAAFAAQMKKEDHVTVIYVGEGATEEGVFAESLNFAALKKLPVLFVCENNLYSVYSPLGVRQSPKRDRCAIARAHGCFTASGEGNRIEEVISIAGEALEVVRRGEGPAFIEFSTFRTREHCGPHEDPYQPQEERDEWTQRCPLKLFESDEHLTDEMKRSMDVKISEEIEEAFAFAETSPFPEFDPKRERLYV